MLSYPGAVLSVFGRVAQLPVFVTIGEHTFVGDLTELDEPPGARPRTCWPGPPGTCPCLPPGRMSWIAPRTELKGQ